MEHAQHPIVCCSTYVAPPAVGDINGDGVDDDAGAGGDDAVVSRGPVVEEPDGGYGASDDGAGADDGDAALVAD